MDTNQFIEDVIAKIKSLKGVDLIYFLDKNNQIIKEHKITAPNNYSEQITKILKSESLLETIGRTFLDSKSFQTYTLLNENGLIIISRLAILENPYMIIIAGEEESVDLINLLKICKEAQSNAILQACE